MDGFTAQHGLGQAALGGDFNREAENSLMAQVTGAFENCVDGATLHGWNGTGHVWREFDHIFVTRPATGRAISSCDIDEARMDTTENTPGIPTNGFFDHAPVVARLGDQPVPARVPGDLRNSDGKPDLVAVDSTGKLYVHPGDGQGGISARREIGTGGWLGASVSHRGDWTGDGWEDLVARVGTQLRVYPGGMDGRLKSPVGLGTVTAAETGLATPAQTPTLLTGLVRRLVPVDYRGVLPLWRSPFSSATAFSSVSSSSGSSIIPAAWW
ncbi:FG-GAP repeat domain-containing protein [Streptomyces sp. NPDC056400]|uniref:FG-GAP repeat domain-containing protein n=1 Tax=Streptomyces sp. NPDC056400 TaxID=3345808 RepID=UPI0035D58DB3